MPKSKYKGLGRMKPKPGMTSGRRKGIKKAQKAYKKKGGK